MKHRHFSRKVWHHRKHLRNKSLDGLPKLKLSPQLCLFVGDALHQILINCTILNDLTVLTSLLNHIASNILKPTLLLLYRSLQPKPFLDPTSTTTDIRIRCFPYLALPEFDFHPGVSMHHLHFGTPNRPNPGQNLPCHHRVQGDWQCLLVHVSGWRWLHGYPGWDLAVGHPQICSLESLAELF